MRRFRSRGRALPRAHLLAHTGCVSDPKPKPAGAVLENLKALAALLAVAGVIVLAFVATGGSG